MARKWDLHVRPSYVTAGCLFVIFFFSYQFRDSITTRFGTPIRVSSYLHPQVFVDCLTNGQWERNTSVSKDATAFMNMFIREHRTLIGLPNPLQRVDKKCGNISFSRQLNWYRAVCDPHQSTPCCYKGTCRSLTTEQCRCDKCYDLRQDLHAELSTWNNNDNRCKVHFLDKDEICKALDITEMILVGDSHMRHTYMALQTMIAEDDVNVYTVPHAPPEIKASCQGIMRYRKDCNGYLRAKIQACTGRLKVHFKEIASTGQSSAILNTVGSLLNKTGSLLVISIAHHDSFNYEKISSYITSPVLDMIEKSGNIWPKVIWIGGHSMGTMKTPTVANQSNPHVIKFNRAMRKFVTERGVTFFDWYNLTKNVNSAEGSHFYKAANELKARVLLNFLTGVGSVKNLPDFTSKPEKYQRV